MGDNIFFLWKLSSFVLKYSGLVLFWNLRCYFSLCWSGFFKGRLYIDQPIQQPLSDTTPNCKCVVESECVPFLERGWRWVAPIGFCSDERCSVLSRAAVCIGRASPSQGCRGKISCICHPHSESQHRWARWLMKHVFLQYFALQDEWMKLIMFLKECPNTLVLLVGLSDFILSFLQTD